MKSLVSPNISLVKAMNLISYVPIYVPNENQHGN